ncbi:MAG: (2E,6E)-farnesyl diphosphate synthase [Gammaproteobacteria bacterium]|nr:(2E,6E)-farnesyl diphosphate synthase [Gammaproteobacteria bacterium]
MDDALAELMRLGRDRVERALERWLPAAGTPPSRLHEAMRYAVLGAGKRIRPVLVYGTGRALGLDPEQLDAPACAVELIHAYSLVHDDLPAMDDDDLRRGRPTCHRAYDEATALLVGDALQTLAFYALAHDEAMPCNAAARLQMVETLALASGSRGMAGGQALDLAAVGRRLELAELENMHIHKTGALIRASVRLGLLCHDAVDASIADDLDHYAKCIGLAFQIRDDILDVEGDTATLGKPQGSDAGLDKPTYPSLLGLAESKHLAGELCADAVSRLAALDARADPLRQLADYIVARTH